MKKHTLLRALRILAGATDTKSHAPALSAVLIQNDGPGHVLLRANNLEREIVVRFPGQVAGGPVGASVKQLRRMVDAMGNPETPDDLLLSVAGGKKLAIARDTQKVTLPGVNPDDFPPPCFDRQLKQIAEPVRMNALGLLDGYEWVRSAVSTDTTRPALAHVRFEPSGRAWASDGHRVHLRQMDAPLCAIPVQILAPSLDALKLAISTLGATHLVFEVYGQDEDQEEPGKFASHVHRFTLRDAAERQAAGTGMVVEFYDRADLREVMPDVDAYMPSADAAVVFNTTATALAAPMKFMDRLGLSSAVLGFTTAAERPGPLLLEGTSHEDGESVEDSIQPASNSRVATTFRMGVKPGYLLAALDGMDRQISVEAQDHRSPLVIRSASSTALIGPMRLPENDDAR